MSKSILLVPACEPGKGGGHLSRCMALVRDLRSLGREAWLFLSDNLNKLLDNSDFDRSWLATDNIISTKPWEFIILDRFQTPGDELARWKEIAPVIGIDEGGKHRSNFDFLIDILIPKKISAHEPNISDVSLLKFPPKSQLKKRTADNKLKILVTFGHEDPTGLGIKTVENLLTTNHEGIEITLIRGGLNNEELIVKNEKRFKIIDSIPNLSERLGEYDLVITHYGITAYEALYAGTSVLLVNPTPYHEKLSKAAGFKTVKPKFTTTEDTEFHGEKYIKKIAPDMLAYQNSVISVVKSLAKFRKYCNKLASFYGLDKEGRNLAELVNRFSPQVNRFCLVCREKAPVECVTRFSERTYRRCGKCGIIFMDRINPPPVVYEREYFFESYKRQYGKTYIEDFPNLIAMAKRRLSVIKASREWGVGSWKCVGEKGKGRLLDIGCAYGAFLIAAREEGYSTYGIEPAEDAVKYVNEKLNIPAVTGYFPNFLLPTPYSPPYDIITLWYVIEHFTDCSVALSEVNKLLKSGGILAFSTPSFSGVSGKASLRKFLEKSPADHYTIWSPVICKKPLSLAGFKVKKVVNIGHHPKRFPVLGKLAKSKLSPMYWLLLAISRILKLGDTFEVYAVKN
ncbi:MAG: methyltransferase domain-containing protein [Treponema sp.]|jgi:spore coat polysaccharide biosynthesis predicted glycosyltransferase SpsG/2-polyprenyl-3-methyl-5-hydroxy-6-metoxy-1,4-benzoquinol methylase|nr:methyltransferase domain-containing protein [Treponema sp.]